MLKTKIRSITYGILASSALAFGLAANDDTQTNIDMPKLSETFGNLLGKNIKESGFDFDIDKVVVGIKKGSAGEKPPLSTEEYEKMMMLVSQNALQKLSSENLRKADAFMSDNANAENVVTLVPNKLQYLVLTPGKGEKVTEDDTPLIEYTGKFADGTVFSSSEETGGPIAIPLKHTIPGFQKGIAGMAEGEKRRLFIHPDEGYGSSAGHLPPNSLLIFDIQVVSAKSGDDADNDTDDDTDNDDDEDDSDNQE